MSVIEKLKLAQNWRQKNRMAQPRLPWLERATLPQVSARIYA